MCWTTCHLSYLQRRSLGISDEFLLFVTASSALFLCCHVPADFCTFTSSEPPALSVLPRGPDAGASGEGVSSHLNRPSRFKSSYLQPPHLCFLLSFSVLSLFHCQPVTLSRTMGFILLSVCILCYICMFLLLCSKWLLSLPLRLLHAAVKIAHSFHLWTIIETSFLCSFPPRAQVYFPR